MNRCIILILVNDVLDTETEKKFIDNMMTNLTNDPELTKIRFYKHWDEIARPIVIKRVHVSKLYKSMDHLFSYNVNVMSKSIIKSDCKEIATVLIGPHYESFMDANLASILK